jgi:hypothetical protein
VRIEGRAIFVSRVKSERILEELSQFIGRADQTLQALNHFPVDQHGPLLSQFS